MSATVPLEVKEALLTELTTKLCKTTRVWVLESDGVSINCYLLLKYLELLLEVV